MFVSGSNRSLYFATISLNSLFVAGSREPICDLMFASKRPHYRACRRVANLIQRKAESLVGR